MITRKLCRFITWICLCWLPWHTVESHYFWRWEGWIMKLHSKATFRIVKITLGNPFSKAQDYRKFLFIGWSTRKQSWLAFRGPYYVLKSLDPRITLASGIHLVGMPGVWSWGAVHSAFPSTPSIAEFRVLDAHYSVLLFS